MTLNGRFYVYRQRERPNGRSAIIRPWFQRNPLALIPLGDEGIPDVSTTSATSFTILILPRRSAHQFSAALSMAREFVGEYRLLDSQIRSDVHMYSAVKECYDLLNNILDVLVVGDIERRWRDFSLCPLEFIILLPPEHH